MDWAELKWHLWGRLSHKALLGIVVVSLWAMFATVIVLLVR